jgi:molybdopterin-binding protein
MSVTQITDHGARAIARLAMQYIDKSLMQGVCSAIGVQTQDIESGLFGIYTAQDIDLATGVSLEVIGYLLEENKNGLSDTEFRAVLQAKIEALVGNATRDDMIAIVDAIVTTTLTNIQVTTGTGDFEIIANSAAGSIITDVIARRAARILNIGKAAGVRAILKYRNFTTTGNASFQYDTVGGEYDVGKYWGHFDRA